MSERSPVDASSVLDVLADLSPSAQQRSSGLTVPLDWFRWLPVNSVRLFLSPQGPVIERPGAQVPVGISIERSFGERLAAIDRIRPGEQRSLRVGWLFVAGRRPLGDGRMQRVFHPLLSVPVKAVLPPVLGSAGLYAAGDVEVTNLVTDPHRRHQLEASYEVGGGSLDAIQRTEIDELLLRRLERLRAFAIEASEAAGFKVSGLEPVSAGPDKLLRRKALTVVAGVGVFTAQDVGGYSAAASLRSWAGRPIPRTTAFHALYLGSGPELDLPNSLEPGGVAAPFPLTPTQRAAVAVSRSAAISVVSGAPGTGKSHTVSAIACDAVGRGETVLVAAKSDAAVDALLVLLRDAPGPDPVVFGSSERRDELATRLEGGVLRPAERAALAAADLALHDLLAARNALVGEITSLLEAEAHARGDDGAVDGVGG